MGSKFAPYIVLLLLLSACAATDDRRTSTLTLIHLNDTYRMSPVEDGAAGGFGRVVTVIRSLQSEGRDVHILHAGDFLYPSLESQLWNGLQMVDALNFVAELAPIYLVAGNHDFEHDNPEHLVNAIRASRFHWLGDNYRLETGEADVDSALQSGFSFRHDDKVIGVFSLTMHPDEGDNDRPYVRVDRDYVGIAEKVISDFENRGADLIVGLTHLDFATDLEIAKLKAAHPRFVFVVGGHEHEPRQSQANSTAAAVMKGASNARVIWQIDVEFDPGGRARINGQALDMDRSVVEDSEFLVVQNKWRNELLEKFPFLEARIGAAAIPLDATEATIRNEETSWGNFITDQMRLAFGEPAADLAFLNSGTLRIDDYIADEVNFEDVGRTFGFSSFLRYMTMTGAEFRQVMEAGYRGTGPSKGYFPQVSGFRVCIDRGRPEGSRIVSLQVPGAAGWREIDADREYTVVVPDFLYGGGDGYVMPKNRTASRPGSELKYLVLDAILRAQREGRAIGEPVDPANPRFVELDSERTVCFD